jgi:hypothetical protein
MKSKTSISAIISYSIAGIYTADYHENMQRGIQKYIYIERERNILALNQDKNK